MSLYLFIITHTRTKSRNIKGSCSFNENVNMVQFNNDISQCIFELYIGQIHCIEYILNL